MTDDTPGIMAQLSGSLVRFLGRCFVLAIGLTPCYPAIGEEPSSLATAFSSGASADGTIVDLEPSLDLASGIPWSFDELTVSVEPSPESPMPAWRGSVRYLSGDQNGGFTSAARDQMDWDDRLRIGSGISFSLDKSIDAHDDQSSSWMAQGLYFGSEQGLEYSTERVSYTPAIDLATGLTNVTLLGLQDTVTITSASIRQAYQSDLGSLTLNRKWTFHGANRRREFWAGINMGYQGERLRRVFEFSSHTLTQSYGTGIESTGSVLIEETQSQLRTEYPTLRSTNLMIGPNLGFRQHYQSTTRFPVEAFANVAMMYNRSNTRVDTVPLLTSSNPLPPRTVDGNTPTTAESFDEFSLATAIGVRAGWRPNSTVLFQAGIQRLGWTNQHTVFSGSNTKSTRVVAVDLGITAQY